MMSTYIVTDNGNIVANIEGVETFISNDGKTSNPVENPCFEKLKNSLKIFETKETTARGVYQYHKNMISAEEAKTEKDVDDFNSSNQVSRCDLGSLKIQLRSNGKLYRHNFGWQKTPLNEFSKTAIRARLEHSLPLIWKEGKNTEYDMLVSEVKKEIQRKIEAEKSLATKVEELKVEGIIPASLDNIATLLRWLNTENWGTWKLPALSVGYSAHQFDCDGKTATGIKLDEKIDGDYKFCVGAPRGYINSYRRLR